MQAYHPFPSLGPAATPLTPETEAGPWVLPGGDRGLELMGRHPLHAPTREIAGKVSAPPLKVRFLSVMQLIHVLFFVDFLLGLTTSRALF